MKGELRVLGQLVEVRAEIKELTALLAKLVGELQEA